MTEPTPADELRAAAADASAHRFCHVRLMAQCQRAEQAEAELRRLAAVPADEEQPENETPEEAYPTEHTWRAELYDPLAKEWAPGTRYSDRDRAVAALAHGRRIGPTWKDGTPTERRLVRATTTYTVETAPLAVVPQPEEATAPDTVHACPPPDGSGLTPCCGQTPFELPLGDRMSSSEEHITCPGAPTA